MNPNNQILVPLLGALAAAVLIACAQGRREPESASSRASSPVQIIDEALLDAERGRILALAEKMSDQELCAAAAALLEDAEQEQQWAEYLDVNIWHFRDSCDEKAHERWTATWAEASSELHGKAAVVADLLRFACADGEPERVLYANAAAMLPQVREARMRITRGVLVDVYQVPADSPRLAAWAKN